MRKPLKYALLSGYMTLGAACFFTHEYGNAKRGEPWSISFPLAFALSAGAVAFAGKSFDAIDKARKESNYRTMEPPRTLDNSDEYSGTNPALTEYYLIDRAPVREGKPFVN